MTVSDATIEVIPKGIFSAGAVRFYPRFTSSVPGMYGASSFYWQFGDGATSTSWNPYHVFPTVTGASPYNVSVTIKDAAGGGGYSTTVQWLVVQDVESAIDEPQNDGTYFAVSVLLYDDAGNSMLANRSPWTGCSMNLLSPKVALHLDKIGTATFSLLDVGTSTATERGLVSEGTNVLIYACNSIVFSGTVRRVTQDLQNGFTSTTRIKKWDLECDSDLARLTKKSPIYVQYGKAINDTPGNIARAILAPTPNTWDARGIINCTEGRILYNLSSSYTSEDPGSMYEHLLSIQSATNYDLMDRPDFLIYEFSAFDGATAFTFSGTAWASNEFANNRVAVVSHDPSGVKTFGTVSSNTSGTIYSSDLVGASTSPTTAGFLIIYRGHKIDFASDLSPPSAVRTLNVNSDVFDYSDNDDKRKLFTKFTARGKDIYGRTISVTMPSVNEYNDTTQRFEGTARVTQRTDGYIYKHGYTISGTDYGQPLAYNEYWLYGGNFALSAGDPIWIDNGTGTMTSLTVSSVSGESNTGGVLVTKIFLTGTISENIAGIGFLFGRRIYVDDASPWYGTTFAASIGARIGEEANVGPTVIGNHTTYGNYLDCVGRQGIFSAKSYPHDVGALVVKLTNSTTKTPSEATPAAYSAVSDYGTISFDNVVDGNITYGTLDSYVASAMYGFSTFYKKATCWATNLSAYAKRVGPWYKGYQASVPTNIRVADRVAIVEYTGATPEEFQVVGVKIDFDTGKTDLELGDYEKNAFTSIEQKTNALNRTLT